MFSGCANLKSLDLSSFNTSNVENVKAIFDGCTSLEYLDISNFNTSQVTEYVNMFKDVNPLKYINLYNAQIKDEIKDKIKDIIIDSTIICQKDDFKIGEDITYIKACCEYNDNILKCSSENYITIQYNKNITYENGFQINNYSEYRKNIIFIQNEESIINPTGKLEIKSDSKIEIHLNNSIQSLASFFNSTYDKNAKDIISIDFSHFDSSLITDTNSLFYGCSSLLKLDLNNFITNPETSMENMFSGCDSLEYLDISGFNINSYDILNGLSNLKFINLYNSSKL
jgi:surface protein